MLNLKTQTLERGEQLQYPDSLKDPKMEPAKNGSMITLGNLGDY